MHVVVAYYFAGFFVEFVCEEDEMTTEDLNGLIVYDAGICEDNNGKALFCILTC